MSLHVPTVAMMATLVGVELALCFVLVGWTLGRQRGLGAWIAGAGCIAAGGLFWGLRDAVPELAVILVGNGAQFLGFALLHAGARDFCGRTRALGPLWIGLPLFLGALAFFATAIPSTRARVAVFGLAIAPWCFAIAFSLYRHAPLRLRTSARIAGGIFLLHGAYVLARLFMPQEGTSTFDLLRPGVAQTLTALEIFVSSIATMLALVALLAHRLVDEFSQAARVDGLTGLLNRRALEQEGRQTVELCASMMLPCAVLFFDVDHFKRLNDVHGHVAGDVALRHLAELIAGTLRRSDLFARYGGEEFVAVIPGAGLAEARAAAERLRQRVQEHPAVVGRATIPLSVSVGVASGMGESLASLVSRADRALYLAKDGGRNRVIEAAA